MPTQSNQLIPLTEKDGPPVSAEGFYFKLKYNKKFRLGTDFEMREVDRQRPKSWTSTASNESSCSQSTRNSDDSNSTVDSNGNTQTATIFGSPHISPLNSPLVCKIK